MYGQEQTAESSMIIEIGPVGNVTGKCWDEKERTEIVQIFISHDDKIRSLQFQYFENGNLVLSARRGWNDGSNFDAVKLNYPLEYITCVSGSKRQSHISSIAFTSNLDTYGPFGRPQKGGEFWFDGESRLDGEFRFQLGKDKQFGGFYGSCDNHLRSIGVYLKPIMTMNIQQNQNNNDSTVEEQTEHVGIEQLV